jgi:hypothetical protein
MRFLELSNAENPRYDNGVHVAGIDPSWSLDTASRVLADLTGNAWESLRINALHAIENYVAKRYQGDPVRAAVALSAFNRRLGVWAARAAVQSMGKTTGRSALEQDALFAAADFARWGRVSPTAAPALRTLRATLERGARDDGPERHSAAAAAALVDAMLYAHTPSGGADAVASAVRHAVAATTPRAVEFAVLPSVRSLPLLPDGAGPDPWPMPKGVRL